MELYILKEIFYDKERYTQDIISAERCKNDECLSKIKKIISNIVSYLHYYRTNVTFPFLGAILFSIGESSSYSRIGLFLIFVILFW